MYIFLKYFKTLLLYSFSKITEHAEEKYLRIFMHLPLSFIIFHQRSYPLSQSATYRVPLNPTRLNALEYISTFALSPHPEVFGLHENADINRNNKETNSVSTHTYI